MQVVIDGFVDRPPASDREHHQGRVTAHVVPSVAVGAYGRTENVALTMTVERP